MTEVINVLFWAARAEDDQLNEAYDSRVFNQWDLTHLSRIEYTSLFIQHNVNITTYLAYMHKMPRMRLRGTELTLCDAFFTQQHARQQNKTNWQSFITIVYSL